jgi:hypothetical protein
VPLEEEPLGVGPDGVGKNWRFPKPLGVPEGVPEGVGAELEGVEKLLDSGNWRLPKGKPPKPWPAGAEGLPVGEGVPLRVLLGVPLGVPVGCSWRFSMGRVKGRLEEISPSRSGKPSRFWKATGVGVPLGGGPEGVAEEVAENVAEEVGKPVGVEVGASLGGPGKGAGGPWGRARAQPIKPIAAKPVYFIVKDWCL